MSQPVPLPFPVQAVVGSDLLVESVAPPEVPVHVPFGGGVYDAWLVPTAGAPAFVYRTPPLWSHDLLERSGFSLERIALLIVVSSVAHAPYEFLRFSPAVQFRSLPFEHGVLLVFTS